MISFQFLSKMGKHEVELHGEQVKVSIVDDSRLVAGNISKLKCLIDHRVMGLDLKISSNSIKQMFLCAENCCMIIRSGMYEQEAVKQLLSDDTICFVGTGMNSKLDLYKYSERSGGTYIYRPVCKTGVDIGHLAARVLKKPKLEKCSLLHMAGEVGMAIKPLATLGGSGSSTSQEPNWDAKVFSDEDIKYVLYTIYDAYTSYVLGNKLLGCFKSIVAPLHHIMIPNKEKPSYVVI